MNADKMTREEFDLFDGRLNTASAHEYGAIKEEFWARIDAIQSAPFVPDWNSAPTGRVIAFEGHWVMGPGHDRIKDFYIPAPSNPTDAELSAMWEKLSPEAKKRALEAVREV